MLHPLWIIYQVRPHPLLMLVVVVVVLMSILIIQSAASTMTYMVEFLEYYSWTKPLAPIVQENPWTANFGIAWIMTKFTEPIRLGLAVAVTPSIAKQIGYGRTAKNTPPSSSQSQSQSPTDAEN